MKSIIITRSGHGNVKPRKDAAGKLVARSFEDAEADKFIAMGVGILAEDAGKKTRVRLKSEGKSVKAVVESGENKQAKGSNENKNRG